MSHEVVAALIVQSQKILLGLRSASRELYPDVWDMFGGHVEPGEQHEETLIRELQEELGITPTRWRYLETLTLRIPPSEPGSELSDQLIAHLYLVSAWKGTPFNRQPHEHSVIHWFSVHEISQLNFADASYPALFARYIEAR